MKRSPHDRYVEAKRKARTGRTAASRERWAAKAKKALSEIRRAAARKGAATRRQRKATAPPPPPPAPTAEALKADGPWKQWIETAHSHLPEDQRLGLPLDDDLAEEYDETREAEVAQCQRWDDDPDGWGYPWEYAIEYEYEIEFDSP